MSKSRVLPNGYMDILSLSKLIEQGILPAELIDPEGHNPMLPMGGDNDQSSPVPPPRRRKKRKNKSLHYKEGVGGYVDVVRTVAHSQYHNTSDHVSDSGVGDVEVRRVLNDQELGSQRMLDNIDAALEQSGVTTLNGGIRMNMGRLNELRSSIGNLHRDATFLNHMEQYGVIYEDALEDFEDPYLEGERVDHGSSDDSVEEGVGDHAYVDYIFSRPLCNSHTDMGGSVYFDVMDRYRGSNVYM